MTQMLDLHLLGNVVKTLPWNRGESPRPSSATDYRVARGVGGWRGEAGRSAKKDEGQGNAGPDGVPGRILSLAAQVFGGFLRQLFTQCLRDGCFPLVWKEASLILLSKEGKPVGALFSYRPIYLLDEVDKVLERIIAVHLVHHMLWNGPHLHDKQYGFREGRSMIDAIERVRSLVGAAVDKGGVLAVFLDISNAFNTLPSEEIREALEYHRIHLYLQRAVHHYFSDNGWLTSTGRRSE